MFSPVFKIGLGERLPFDVSVGEHILKLGGNTTWYRFSSTPKWVYICPKQALF